MREIVKTHLSVSQFIHKIIDSYENPEAQSIGIVVDIKNDISKTVLYIADPDTPLYKQEIYLLMEVSHAIFNFYKEDINTYKDKLIFFDYNERYEQVSVYAFCKTKQDIPQANMMSEMFSIDRKGISPYYLFEKEVEPFFPKFTIPWSRVFVVGRRLQTSFKMMMWRFVKKYGRRPLDKELDELSPEARVTLPQIESGGMKKAGFFILLFLLSKETVLGR